MKLRTLWSFVDTLTKVKIVLNDEDAIYLRSGYMIDALSDNLLNLDVEKIKTDSHEEELQIELKEGEE